MCINHFFSGYVFVTCRENLSCLFWFSIKACGRLFWGKNWDC